jgi:hypothetical protein
MQDIRAASKSLENIPEFKHLDTTLTYEHFIYEQIKS